eukprot:1750688-Karenia_brevis.AAC.1
MIGAPKTSSSITQMGDALKKVLDDMAASPVVPEHITAQAKQAMTTLFDNINSVAAEAARLAAVAGKSATADQEMPQSLMKRSASDTMLASPGTLRTQTEPVAA